MAILTPDPLYAGAIDTRWLLPTMSGTAITSITISGGGTSAVVVGFNLIYTGSGLTKVSAEPTGGTYTKIEMPNVLSLDLGTAANFADIDGFDAERVLDGDDYIGGTAFSGDFLFAGYGGNDTLDGKGGGDAFMVSERSSGSTLTIIGASGATDTLFVVANKYDPNAVYLDLRASVLTSIDIISLGNAGVTIKSSQIGNGISQTATIGAFEGQGAFDIVKDTNGGTLDVSGLTVTNTLFKIYGSNTAEAIIGGDADEVIHGELGADTLTGGGGTNAFVFVSLEDSGRKKALRDTITDFKQGVDKIELSQIDAKASTAENEAFKFRAKEGKALKKAGDLVYDQVDKAGTNKDMTIIYADVNGDAKADFSIQLKGLVDLKATDFLL